MENVTPTELAQESFGFIDAAARAARMSMDVNGAAVLVDGTAYSPSTRAVPGADMVYLVGTDDEWEEYQEELDQLCEAYAEHGYSLGWDDGCLWIYGPRYHPEADVVLDVPYSTDEGYEESILDAEVARAEPSGFDDEVPRSELSRSGVAMQLLGVALEQLDHALERWAELAMLLEESGTDVIRDHRAADGRRDRLVREYRQLKEGQ